MAKIAHALNAAVTTDEGNHTIYGQHFCKAQRAPRRHQFEYQRTASLRPNVPDSFTYQAVNDHVQSSNLATASIYVVDALNFVNAATP